MELILIIAVVAAAIALRKQGQRLNALEKDVADLRHRLADSPVLAAPSSESVAYEESEPEPEREDIEPEEPVLGPWHQAAARIEHDKPAVSAPPAQPARKRDIETALGTRWTVWVGGIALALGGVFLVRYSIEAGIFGPQVRLAAAILFGLGLAALGEFARRRGFQSPVAGVQSAHIPAILTAAAATTLFGAVYAAHGVYGFIGPILAFVLLGGLALGTVASALLHGQALAGLGLLGSYITPFLVSSTAPDVRALFVYLAIVLAATVAIASLRRWRGLATGAYVGAGLWTLVYLLDATDVSPALVAVLHLVGIAALGALWLRARDPDTDRFDIPSATAGFFTFVVSAFLATQAVDGAPFAAALIVAMLTAAAWRLRALPLLHMAGLSLVATQLIPFAYGLYLVDIYGGRFGFDGMWPGPSRFTPFAAALAVMFLAAGVLLARARVATFPTVAARWTFWASVAPLSVLLATWLIHGNLNIDWRFAALAIALTALLAAAAEAVARAEAPSQTGGLAVSFAVGGSAAALVLGLLAGFGPLLTTILTGLAAALPAAATRMRQWPALGWASAGLAGITLTRICIDPTIVGPESLSTTPILNALTPGYLMPAAAFAYAAWQLARTTGGRARLAMEAFAALFSLVGAAMLVRHAMNGGVIDARDPTLAEQAIYTLIVIGGGAIMLALDRRSPSPVFRWGSMALGVISVLFIISAHLFGLNPLVTNESTGSIPVFNLLLLAYLLPAFALAVLAWRAKGLRPIWYVRMLGIAAAVLGFAYISLSVRRVFQGEFIGAWKGMGEVETYAYSAVWLVIGVAMLVGGLRYNMRLMRTASAVLVVAAVAKVFLYDMRQLEGPLRALSFIGLGGVLIGIGMFYQRMLASTRPDVEGPGTSAG